ncbi:PaaI family thioesterase [Aestuariibacter sp. A3R04]|uniref:PaaI family thioesterase n=1 Tax=Aestuariibacter sp. A3R04 TaxID=2841571 RepID=UPI00352F37DC
MTEALIDRGFLPVEGLTGFSCHIGPFYEKTHDDGTIHRAVMMADHHLNPEGVVHGGVLLSFMDYVIYRAIGDDIGHQIQFATINLNTQFLAAAKKGDIVIGMGNMVRKTRSVIFAHGQLFTQQRPVMTGSGIWKIIGR